MKTNRYLLPYRGQPSRIQRDVVWSWIRCTKVVVWIYIYIYICMQSLYQGFTVSNGLAHELWLLIVSKLFCCFRKRYCRFVYCYYFNIFCHQLLRMILKTKGNALRFFVSLFHSWRMSWLRAARLRTWVMNMCNAHFYITSRLSEPLDGLARDGTEPNTISANNIRIS